MRTKVIEVKNLTRVFGKGEGKTEALKNINLEIHSGEYVMLFGPSGCGKSTLLHSIAGLEPPTTGEVLIRAKNIYKMPPREMAHYRATSIGIIFQQFHIIRSLNVVKNVALPQSFAGIPRGRRLRRAAHLLELLGLSKYHRHIVGELSGGQQQRVAIARALVNNPWILICDEPTGNLDSKNANEVMELIAKLNSQSKRTIVMVTHNPDYIKYPHRVFYMKDGQITKVETKRHFAGAHETDKEPGEIRL